MSGLYLNIYLAAGNNYPKKIILSLWHYLLISIYFDAGLYAHASKREFTHIHLLFLTDDSLMFNGN